MGHDHWLSIKMDDMSAPPKKLSQIIYIAPVGGLFPKMDSDLSSSRHSSVQFGFN